MLAAGRDDTPRASDALAKLCQTYWYPLYAYVRQRGYAPHDAQDLTQEFFARLLAKNTLGAIGRAAVAAYENEGTDPLAPHQLCKSAPPVPAQVP